MQARAVVFGMLHHRWSLVVDPPLEAETISLSVKYDKAAPVSSSDVQRYNLTRERTDLLNILRINYLPRVAVH